MDSLITAAAQRLAAGDPLGALNRVALREDAPALALRGIAMAQLGDFSRAKTLLRRAKRAFGPKEALARARCVIAEAEIALAARELNWPAQALESACLTLEKHHDRFNAAHARYIEARRLLLLGRLDAAEAMLGSRTASSLPPALAAAHDLMIAGIAMRRLRTADARAALSRAAHAARRAAIPGLLGEVEAATRLLETPAARLIAHGTKHPLLLADIEQLQASPMLIIDACRYVVRRGETMVSLVSRPVLFALLRMLAEAWPGDVSRDELVQQGFGAKEADDSHRARLRVEIGRLRVLLKPLAELRATAAGFRLTPRPIGVGKAIDVAVLARPVEEKYAPVLAFLADGEAWSSSALALALGASQRSIQRALETLAAAGKVQSFGQGRARRWAMPPLPGFATSLLLTTTLPGE
ncbi:helix-turn-helix domain-containing protein [Dongia soli]|uniref:Helix-turn-helix domain-containing protein n=1 Tax=Dongia soli TaxID=600628 RepID=A0ABU5E6M8_9PROT|nr:helix-turn-helix domain-containing protein [Dongia soli]MDY0881972.1 helix-turn-helix domain-containing protein [Dongia soli]